MNRRLALALIAMLGCGDDDAATPVVEAPAPYVPPEPTRRPHDDRPEPLARIARVEQHEGSAFQAGQRLGPTATIETGQSGLVLDLREGARVTLEPSTIARLCEESPAQVLLGVGVLHAILPPESGSERPPLRIGTFAGTVAIEGSGDVWVGANAAGRVMLAVVAGRARTYDFDEAGTLRAVDLGAGQSVVIGGEPPAAGPRDAETARAAMRLVIESASPVQAADEIAPVLAALEPVLATAEAEVARGDALQNGERPAPGSPEATERQRALVEHGRALLAARRGLLTRFEMLRARALLAIGQHRDTTDPSAVLRPRVRRALGVEGEEPTE
ncbi:MAG: hypothetical protein R3B99_36375 [Polyangiales bacterium]